MSSSQTWIALVRAIGPATHPLMSMADLRAAATAAGLEEARTLLATGNLLFSSALGEGEIARLLDGIVAARGLDNAVMLRGPGDLRTVIDANPFPEAAEARPSHLLVLFLAGAPAEGHEARLAAYEGPEQVALAGREVFIDYVEGVGRAKLTPARLERIFGTQGTARNWNTVAKLLAACG